MILLWLLLGLLGGALFLAFARSRGKAERKILALGLVIAAVIYLAFALIGGGPTWWLIETLGILVYVALAWLGLRRSPIYLAAGWILHPLWDVALHLVGAGAVFTPEWYAWACVSFDLLVGVYIALSGVRRQ